jgi:hypothetical protein
VFRFIAAVWQVLAAKANLTRAPNFASKFVFLRVWAALGQQNPVPLVSKCACLGEVAAAGLNLDEDSAVELREPKVRQVPCAVRQFVPLGLVLPLNAARIKEDGPSRFET